MRKRLIIVGLILLLIILPFISANCISKRVAPNSSNPSLEQRVASLEKTVSVLQSKVATLQTELNNYKAGKQ